MEGYGGLNFKTLHKFHFFKNFRKASNRGKNTHTQFLSITFLYNSNNMEGMEGMQKVRKQLVRVKIRKLYIVCIVCIVFCVSV